MVALTAHINIPRHAIDKYVMHIPLDELEDQIHPMNAHLVFVGLRKAREISLDALR